MREELDNILSNRQRRTPESVGSDLDSSLREAAHDALDTAIDNTVGGRNVLGRSNEAERRAEQLHRPRNEESRTQQSDTEESGEEVEEQAASSQSDTQEQPQRERTKDSVGFFGRLILIGLVALIIYTVGKYAFDSLLVFNMEKTIIDFDENYKIMFGQDVEVTENIFQPALDLVEDGQYTVEYTTEYTYDKKQKTISFVIDNTTYIDMADTYNRELKKEGGKITLKLTRNANREVVNYEVIGLE